MGIKCVYLNAAQNGRRRVLLLAPDLAGLIRMISRPDEERGERIAFWERLFSGKGKDHFMAGAYDFASDGMLTAEPFFRAFSEE